MSLTESTMLSLGTIAPDFALTERSDRQDRPPRRLLRPEGPARPLHLHPLPLREAHQSGPGRARQGLRRQAHRHRRHQQQRRKPTPPTAPPDSSSRLRPSASSFPTCTTSRSPWPTPTRPPAPRTSFSSTAIFRLVYRGQFDSSRPGNGVPVTGEDLRAAIDLVLAGKPVPTEQRPSIGCNIKWKA
jgi:hypothetical protein